MRLSEESNDDTGEAFRALTEQWREDPECSISDKAETDL